MFSPFSHLWQPLQESRIALFADIAIETEELVTGQMSDGGSHDSLRASHCSHFNKTITAGERELHKSSRVTLSGL